MGGKKLKAMIHVRDSTVYFLTRTEKFLKSTQAADENQIRFRLDKLEANWEEFEGIQADIDSAEDDEDNFEMHHQIRALIDSAPELSGIQKFHYLRASLRGEALKLIDSYPMSEANYVVAWNGLVARFSNGYLLKKRHLNAMFEFPKIRKESASCIHDVIDCFERNTKILDQLGEQTTGWGAMLTHLMVSKLDESTQKRWEEHVSDEVEPSFVVLVEFLKSSISLNRPEVTSFKDLGQLGDLAGKPSNYVSCGEQHLISQCSSFIQLPVDQRLHLTNSKRLCSNSLGRNHLARDCPSNYRCRTCSKKHHTLLHPLHPWFSGSGSTSSPVSEASRIQGQTSTALEGTSSGGSITSSVAVSTNAAVGHPGNHVFLLTVLLKIKDNWGRTHLARGLLDSGSQANLMSERLCQLLKLPRRAKRVEIHGIGQARRTTTHEVSSFISSRIRNFSTSMDFLVLGQVTADQPSSSLPLTNWAPPSGMQLADPEFNVSGPIDLVLGSQYFYDFHILDGGRIQIRKLDSALPDFVNTVFGWVAAGESE
ncbi:uncharacterized protein LOC134207110 [Armigeres subalbatus]|uniref:uncharacterized protein LOC134207110 n=1 Tax=Armigeres subalbatus TaxID=124917 RepID=UPI002ECFCFB2